MDYIKEAFDKVKSDMSFLREEINHLKINFLETNEKLSELFEIIGDLKEKQSNLNPPNTPTQTPLFITNPTDNSTDKYVFSPLKSQNILISTGNEGVPTDKQTDRQTDRQREKTTNSIEVAANILDSLDNLRKDIRLKFKRLTEQEVLVFSTIYQLSEEKGYTDYKTLSQKLNLSESSIRDYVGRLIKKDISVEKLKINNKNIRLKISENFKKIASLSTILQLRDL